MLTLEFASCGTLCRTHCTEEQRAVIYSPAISQTEAPWHCVHASHGFCVFHIKLWLWYTVTKDLLSFIRIKQNQPLFSDLISKVTRGAENTAQ